MILNNKNQLVQTESQHNNCVA